MTDQLFHRRSGERRCRGEGKPRPYGVEPTWPDLALNDFTALGVARG